MENKNKQGSSSSSAYVNLSFQSIVWPVIYPFNIARHLALQHYFRKSERFPEEKLRELQLRQLQLLLKHALQTVPYYQKEYQNTGINLTTDLQWEDWLKLPVLKRSTVQNQFTGLQSSRIPAGHGRTFITSTSGSTGTPVQVMKSWPIQFFWNAVKLRDHYWHQREAVGRKHAAIRFVEDKFRARPPDGENFRSWGFPLNRLYATGPSCLLSIESPVTDQVSWLCKQDPDYLLTNSTNLYALAQAFDSSSLHLKNLKQLITISECLDLEVREYCENVFGVPLKDIYSSQEIGYIALQCPEYTHYHVQAETVLVEVLDDHDQPCKSGEIGRIVVTSLHNFAMPLLRYEIGDYAEVGEPCSCGRTLPVLKRIYGRVRNMLTLPGGKKIWPRIRTQYYAETAGADIRQAQLIQHSLEEIEVRLVVPSPLKEEQQKKLTGMIQEALGHPFHIRYSFLDEIPRSKGGKFEEFISKLDV